MILMRRVLALTLLSTFIHGCVIEGPAYTIRQIGTAAPPDGSLRVILAKQWMRYSWWLWGDQQHWRHRYYLARLDLTQGHAALSDAQFIGQDDWQQDTRFQA